MPDRFPPGPDHNAFQAILSTLRQQQDRLGYLIDVARTYGDICHFHTGLRNIYLLIHPDLVRAVLVEQADKFYKPRPYKRALGRFLGQGLFVLDGDEHRRERRLTQPAFHHQRVAAYASVMVQYAQRLLAGWGPDQQYEISGQMMKVTAGIVARTLFDADISNDTDDLYAAMSIMQDSATRQFRLALRPPGWLPTSQNRREQRTLAWLDDLIFGIINDRRASGTDHGDLLSMLLMARDEDGTAKSIQQVRDEVVTLFVAGHETTSNTLTWAWYLLAQHPEVVNKLHQELADVLGGREPTFADIERLAYTGMIIKETLRLYPPAWIITREAIATANVGGYVLEPGSVVVLSPYITHRLDRYYPEPEAFRPERFAAGSEQALPRFAYYPFGGGPRICIGQSFATMEAILILATIAQHYELALVPGQHISLEPLITLRAKNGIRMTALQRAASLTT